MIFCPELVPKLHTAHLNRYTTNYVLDSGLFFFFVFTQNLGKKINNHESDLSVDLCSWKYLKLVLMKKNPYEFESSVCTQI
jgi:hypothetical protein